MQYVIKYVALAVAITLSAAFIEHVIFAAAGRSEILSDAGHCLGMLITGCCWAVYFAL